METEPRKFDLNMEEVLEAWGVSDAIREVIANALDEQALTGTSEVRIFENDGRWHVRDFGRGLRYEHLVQNEDEEKLKNPDKVIGKFGVGLKDALATFHRNGVEVTIHSAHCTIRVGKASKAGFEEIQTLHGLISPPEEDIQGTDVVLDGVTGAQVGQAKQNFLRFTDHELLEETKFGEVYALPEDETAAIYVSGLRVAREENFLFSYNIVNTTKQVRDALNRERSNVGRTAYSARVKDILQECRSTEVARRLVQDFENFTEGTTHDEVNWKPIRLHAIKLLNERDEVVFASPREQHAGTYLLEQARNDGYRVVTIPESLREEIQEETDASGDRIRGFEVYQEEYNTTFEYEWVSEDDMTEAERRVWNRKDEILDLLHEVPVEDIRISETIRLTARGEMAKGVWEGPKDRIIILRSQLRDLEPFASTLLHELAHPRSGGALDLTQPFEDALCEILGEVTTSALRGS